MRKIKLNIIKLLSVFLALFLIAGSVAKAEDQSVTYENGGPAEVIDGDVQNSNISFKEADFPPPNSNQVKEYNLNGTDVKLSSLGEKLVKADARYTIKMAKDENGKFIVPTADNFKFGLDVVKNALESGIYKDTAFDYLNQYKEAIMKPSGDPKITPNMETGEATVDISQIGNREAMEAFSTTKLMVESVIKGLDDGKSREQIVKEAYALYGVKDNHDDSEKILKLINKVIDDPEARERMYKDFKDLKIMEMLMQYEPPKLKVFKNQPKPGQGACDKWNALPQPGTVTCDDGSDKGIRSKCIVSNDEEYMSSYSTTTPNDEDDPIRNWTPFCDNQLPGYLGFSEIMNPFGQRSYDNDTILNNGTSSFIKYRYTDRFNNNLWKSSWRGEERKWNPFKDGNKLSGIPYYVSTWTDKFDGWYDQDYKMDPESKKAIPLKNEAEANNNRLAQKYGQNGNKFKVFLNAPNKPMEVTALNLDTNTWDRAKTGNAFCSEQYELKTVPRYDILNWDRYRLYDWHHTVTASWTFECVDTDRCKEWAQDCEEYDTKTWECKKYGPRYCAAYYTKLQKVDLGGVNVKYPKGSTTKGPSPAGSIPPVYKQRRKYQYRTGALVEYHTIMKPFGNTKLTPIPKSNDNSKMKSGYGFNYTSGVQMITDYDREPSTYRYRPAMIRPNKATNLNIRTNNYRSSYGLFNPNVQYDSRANAPERSSSIDKTFIEETLRGQLRRTTFRPRVISNVDKVNGRARNLDGVENLPVKSSLVRKRPIRWGEMTSTFRISSDPSKYYHAFWRTKGEPNLIPAYRPGPLHYVYLDYPSGNDYTVASLDTVDLNGRGFFATGMNTGSIKIVGNMWEDSFSRPDFRKSGN